MDKDFQVNLKKYADLIIKVGLNLQQDQKLIIQHLRNDGVPVQAAPLIRLVAESAYQAGARLVDVQWRDDAITLSRFKYAPRDSFEEFPTWRAKGIQEIVEDGGALLTVSSIDPDLMAEQDAKLVDQRQTTFLENWKPISAHIGKNSMNWNLFSVPIEGWARKVFPDLTPDEQMPALWDTLFKICRVYEDDPVAAWESHLANMKKHADHLNEKTYRKLHYTAPGTDLWLTLPEDHIWRSAGFKSQSGIPFTANIPTEEVFTLPDRRFTEGTVKSARPLVYSGKVIDNFSLIFKEGKVVDYSAEQGKDTLAKLLSADDGASMLGEVALVTNSSPISQSGLLFYNTLLDENASCHLALGSAYRFSLDGGEKLSREEFNALGGNSSLVHSDFMVGSGELDIDGVLENGDIEPVFRSGEWAF